MKAWFISRLAREKFLMLLFAAAAAVLWISDLSERGRAAVTDINETRSLLSTQARWLAEQERIEQAAAAAVADLDSSRTFNSLRLSAELSTLAQAAGIDQNLRSEAQPTQQTAQFAVHTVQLTLNRVAWENLLSFYEALSGRAPYISIERFTLESVRNNPAELNARLLVSSVEIADGN
jgi:ABC-type branched-subunit amino acid transport system ATPase component